jgi:hypothetical protein
MKNMTDKEKIAILKHCYTETIWMAIRYAHGRYTYAPSMVRASINDFKKVFPDWKLQKDNTIKHSIEKEIDDVSFHGDYLDDLFTDSDE